MERVNAKRNYLLLYCSCT